MYERKTEFTTTTKTLWMKKPSFTIEDLLFAIIVAEVLVIEGEHQPLIARVGSSTSDLRCPCKNCKLTTMTFERQIKHKQHAEEWLEL